jgi:hypothetical protein
VTLPISRAQFDKGKGIVPLGERVLGFLTKHRDQAYSTLEIVREMYGSAVEDPIGSTLLGEMMVSVQVSLESLIKEQKVSGKIVATADKREVYFVAT